MFPLEFMLARQRRFTEMISLRYPLPAALVHRCAPVLCWDALSQNEAIDWDLELLAAHAHRINWQHMAPMLHRLAERRASVEPLRALVELRGADPQAPDSTRASATRVWQEPNQRPKAGPYAGRGAPSS